MNSPDKSQYDVKNFQFFLGLAAAAKENIIEVRIKILNYGPNRNYIIRTAQESYYLNQIITLSAFQDWMIRKHNHYHSITFLTLGK